MNLYNKNKVRNTKKKMITQEQNLSFNFWVFQNEGVNVVISKDFDHNIIRRDVQIF